MTTDFKRNSLGRTRVYEYPPPPPPTNALVTALRILLQELNLETKLGPTQGNIDLLKVGLEVFGVQSF